MLEEMLIAFKETFIMTSIPACIALLFGIPLGAALYLTRKGQIMENKYIYYPTIFYVNTVRSFPFLVFVVVMIPVTRFFIGTGFGPYAASFPISFVSVALYSRFVEQSFYDVSPGIIDVAKVMKANIFELICHFLLVESRSSLVLGFTSTVISIIAYSTVMGIVGGGGIGDYAIRYGYYEYDYEIMFKVVFILIILVFIIQMIGNFISRKLDKRRREF